MTVEEHLESVFGEIERLLSAFMKILLVIAGIVGVTICLPIILPFYLIGLISLWLKKRK